MRLGILEIHGIGEEKRRGFSAKRIALINKYSGKTFHILESHWGYITENQSDVVLNNRFPKEPLSPFKRASFKAREFGLSFLSDTFQYEKGSRKRIQAHVLKDLECLLAHCDKVLLFGHSLGALIAYDLIRYLRPSLKERIAGLLTTGSPIPYFRYENIKDIKMPWLNIWEYSDFISMPTNRSFCDDYEWKDRKLFIGKTVATHRRYRGSKKLAKLIVKYFKLGE